MGAPVGNQNAVGKGEFRQALRRVMARENEGDYRRGLERVAKALYEKAVAGDPQAGKEVADREDGKPNISADIQVSGSLTTIIEALPVLAPVVPGSDKPLA